METVQRIIAAAGGIPTYPFLADDAKGAFTDFEGDLMKAADTLKKRGFRSVEFITTRNTTAVLEQYAGYLEDEGFTVTFGSEHNTPALEPIKLRTRDAADLSDKLKEINYRGACTVAAHQAGLKTIEEGDALITKTVTA
jgi:sugar phosphate isomerase/epimerase